MKRTTDTEEFFISDAPPSVSQWLNSLRSYHSLTEINSTSKISVEPGGMPGLPCSP
jgi:hypothetical protein